MARGLATTEQVERAHRESRARGEPICSRLFTLGLDEGDLAAVLAEKHGVPGVDLSRSAVPLGVLDLVPRAVAEGDLIFPLSREGGRVHLAMARPWDERVLAELRFITGLEVSAYVAVRGALLRALAEAYEARGRGATLWRGNCSASGAPHLAAIVPGGTADPFERELIQDADIVIEVDAAEPPPRPGGRKLVLVVDDEPDIQHLVRRMLEGSGFAVELASDGEEALEKADRLVPDLVLLDAMLPKVHGFDACRRIKGSARTGHVPVIMMTAIYRGWRFAQDARESYGASDYVEKPFRMDDLLRRIDEALRAGGGRPSARAVAEPLDDPRLSRGKQLLAEGRIAEAVAELSEVARASPRSADAQFQLGRALRAAGDLFGAMTALERASQVSPRHLAALRALASVYEETGFRRKAAQMLERALSVAGDDAARAAIRDEIVRILP